MNALLQMMMDSVVTKSWASCRAVVFLLSIKIASRRILPGRRQTLRQFFQLLHQEKECTLCFLNLGWAYELMSQKNVAEEMCLFHTWVSRGLRASTLLSWYLCYFHGNKPSLFKKVPPPPPSYHRQPWVPYQLNAVTRASPAKISQIHNTPSS